MKMICPHCGVKGSADDSLLDKKVKCPKCLGMFVVDVGVLEPIPVAELDLEQVEETSAPSLDTAVDSEVDDMFNELLGSDSPSPPGEDFQESDIDRILTGEMEADGELVEGVAAALSTIEEEPASEWLGEEEDEDNTLTVIDDFPEEAISLDEKADDDELITLDDPGVADDIEDELSLDSEEDLSLESGKFDWNDVEDEPPALDASEEIEEDEDTLEFDDEAGPESDTLEFDDEVGPESDTLEFDDDEPNIIVDESEDESEEESDDDILEWDKDDKEDAGEEELSVFDDEAEDLDQDDDVELTVDEAEAELEDDAFDEDVEGEDVFEEQDEDLEDGAEEGTEEETEVETEENPEAIHKCSACGEYVDQKVKYKLGSNVYCDKCVPRKDKTAGETSELAVAGSDMAAAGAAVTAAAAAAVAAAEAPGKFTVTTLIKDAYHYSKGAKGSIWGAFIVMYIILIGLGVASVFLLPQAMSSSDPMTAMFVEGGFQMVTSILSGIMTAGILLIAIRKIGNQPFSWKMVFSGFKKFGSLLLLFIIETIMVLIGFLLLVLPGIYLSIGYMLAIPLVMVRGMSPWQALETSRKAIHTRWWTVFFSLIAMSLLMTISAIPLGLGLIWTVPMFVVLIGILYYHFFGDTE